jgi:vitamin B12/bleomycin/antimicrobial peptide transport system ATP-binding/permease protein
MGVLGILEIAMVLYLTEWRKHFWTYVSDKNLEGFILYLGIFTGVALLLCVIVATATYTGTRAAIAWRQILNERAIKLQHINVENVTQRIQEDCSKYPDLVMTIGYGVLKATVYLVVFSIALCVEFNYIYLLLITAYAILATVVAKKIGNPLIKLNYQMQQTEATYRGNITAPNFKDCIMIQLSLARKLKHLQYFQSLYGQLGVVIPLIIIAPAYFTTAMLLGSLMQANSIMSTITDNMSYGINNFDVFNKLLSCHKRLKELGVLK